MTQQQQQQQPDLTSRVFLAYLTILLFGGLLGHATSAAIFCRYGNLASANTRRLLVSLAAADSLVLLTAVLRYWTSLVFGYDLRLGCQFVCVGHSFAVYVFGDLALWLLVALCLVRLLAVLRPTWRRPHTSTCFLPALMACLTLASIARNCPLLLYVRLQATPQAADTPENSNSSSVVIDAGAALCEFAPTNSQARIYQAFTLVDFVTYSAVPCCLLAISNIWLALLLYRTRARRRRLVGTGSESAPNETDPQSRSGSQLALVLSVFYLCSNLPTVGFSAFSTMAGNSGIDPGTADIVSQYLVMFHYSANGTSFLFYCTFNASFRSCLRHLFGCLSRGSREPER